MTKLLCLFGLGWSLSCLRLDAGADRVVNRLRFASTGVQLLFVVGIDKGVFAVLTDEDFIRHEDILTKKRERHCRSLYVTYLWTMNCLPSSVVTISY